MLNGYNWILRNSGMNLRGRQETRSENLRVTVTLHGQYQEPSAIESRDRVL